MFLSHGLGGGLAAGLTYTPGRPFLGNCHVLIPFHSNAALAIGTHYFKRHRGLSIGIAASGAALGMILHNL